MNPQALPEWEAYVAALAGQALWDKAVAANSIEFADVLSAAGMGPPAFRQVMLFFARQFAASGQRPPMEGLVDLSSLAADDPVAAMGRTLSDEEIQVLEDNPPPELPGSGDQDP